MGVCPCKWFGVNVSPGGLSAIVGAGVVFFNAGEEGWHACTPCEGTSVLQWGAWAFQSLEGCFSSDTVLLVTVACEVEVLLGAPSTDRVKMPPTGMITIGDKFCTG